VHLRQRLVDLGPGQQVQKRRLGQVDLQGLAESVIEGGVARAIGEVGHHHIAELGRMSEAFPCIVRRQGNQRTNQCR
jgi:predicted urease superfamily metal-dependent hydrolase